MKKATILLFMAAAVFACSRKTVASADNKPKTETATTEVKTTTIATTASNTTADAHAALIAQGQTVYTTRCAKCHEAKSVSAYNTQQWDGILKSMIPKAKLDATQSAQVTAYVMANAKKS